MVAPRRSRAVGARESRVFCGNRRGPLRIPARRLSRWGPDDADPPARRWSEVDPQGAIVMTATVCAWLLGLLPLALLSADEPSPGAKKDRNTRAPKTESRAVAP